MDTNNPTLTLTHESLRTGAGQVCVNNQHILITQPLPGNLADVTERAVAAGKVLVGRNIALYGMAALEEDPESPGQQKLVPNATLINRGVIEIHMKEMVEAFRDKVKKSTEDEEGTYRFVKCFAMAAGKDSLIINEGTIRIVFDHDIDTETAVYGETLVAGENSTVLNHGRIEIVGNGSFNTQARAIAVPANNTNILNHGDIHLQLDRAATVRVLATTGVGGLIANYGHIYVNSTGRIMTLARFTGTRILNEGSIDIVSRARFIVNKVSFLYQSYPLACAFYEHSLPNQVHMPPIINNGTVKIHLEGSEESTPHAVAFGIYSEMVGMEEQIHHFENNGTITVTKSGPYDFTVAEIGANVQAKKDFPYHIEIGTWRTAARDFAQTKDLFVCGSGHFDFAQLHLLDADGAPLPVADKAALVSQTEEAKEQGFTCDLV